MKIGRRHTLFVLICFFTGLTSAFGQSEFNSRALEYFKHGLECLVIGDYDNAILYCNAVLRYESNSAATYAIRARAYFEKGDMDNAIADSTQALRLDRNNISAHIIRGNAYAISGNIDRAISDWQAVLKVNPENNEAKVNLDLARQRQES